MGRARRALRRELLEPRQLGAAAAELELLGNRSRNVAAAVAATQLEAFTSATRPAASVAWHRKLITLRDAGTPEKVQACVLTSGGGYEWITVALASQ